MTDNKTFWNKWAKRYDRAMSVDGKMYVQIVIRMKKKLNQNMTLLELADGTRLLSIQLVGRVKKMEATDFSEDMIKDTG